MKVEDARTLRHIVDNFDTALNVYEDLSYDNQKRSISHSVKNHVKTILKELDRAASIEMQEKFLQVTMKCLQEHIEEIGIKLIKLGCQPEDVVMQMHQAGMDKVELEYTEEAEKKASKTAQKQPKSSKKA